MDSLISMNNAIAYIEANLTNDIDLKEVAQRAYCSEYHFKRMFSFLAGISLSDYIRRRRLTLAAFELSNSSMRILDIAIRYGYSSADSFARAFQQMHGITPSEARQSGQYLKAFPRMTFQLTITGGNEMNYRIEQKEAFHIIGLMKRVPIVFQGENPTIVEMAQSLTMEDIEYLKELSNIEPRGIIQASTNFSEDRMVEKGELDHYIGVATTLAPTKSFTQLHVPASTWAVFEAVGPFPHTLQKIWGRIYAEWFPSSAYEQIAGPEIVHHASTDFTSSSFQSEIWIPIQKC
ncbi:AraC family transcriptional regulator [Lysinibacillus macroides]|uniref:AraC family transcriptional regulator n=1 Tax=Lysinibacillus macroides TaxID=33935 RepID=A0A0M9DM47_9BACI|nr:AraC family transcriptional regulator [Lysinibacillus macroides]KOY83433.1 AraC family transcriptional regulator [Lysinibacillus macroides]QPR69303.1 AraC family transcriptional regulator [Lysinibacillus macroides]